MLPPYARCVDLHTSCSWHHAQLVSDYRVARLTAEDRHDILYGGCPEESDEHRHEMITFHKWLKGYR